MSRPATPQPSRAAAGLRVSPKPQVSPPLSHATPPAHQQVVPPPGGFVFGGSTAVHSAPTFTSSPGGSASTVNGSNPGAGGAGGGAFTSHNFSASGKTFHHNGDGTAAVGHHGGGGGGGASQLGGSGSPNSSNNIPGSTPGKAPAGMMAQWDNLQMRQFLIRTWKFIVIGASCFGLLLLVIAWGVAIKTEGEKVHRRHIASIIGFILAAVTIIMEVIALRTGPYPILLYSIQALAALSLVMNSLSMGMNDVVVDICSANDPILQTPLDSGFKITCSAHYLELTGVLLLIGAMVSIYTTTQQSIVVMVDKGILKGIGTRLSSG